MLDYLDGFDFITNTKYKQAAIRICDDRGNKYNSEIISLSSSAFQNIELIDFLRSKSYDCGYGSIPSLIAEGIAIDKTKLNK
jgi:hypothetical protein